MSVRHVYKLFFTGLFLAFISMIANAEPLVNQPAPVFSNAATANGNNVNLADFLGKTVILEWTNHECPFVKKHYETGNIPNLQKQAAAQGIV